MEVCGKKEGGVTPHTASMLWSHGKKLRITALDRTMVAKCRMGAKCLAQSNNPNSFRVKADTLATHQNNLPLCFLLKN